jgi:rSAM/selenodomain-associated transferase 2
MEALMLFSIIMPVLNEAEVLEGQLAHLTRQCAGHAYELLIVDGGSTDKTVTIAERYGRVSHAPRGRAKQMNAGAAAARGDVLLFLHADTQLPDEALRAIEKALESQEVVGGAFRLCFDCQQWSYRFVALTTNLRSQIRRIFTGDQAYFVRTASFKAVGGYPDQPLMEDLEIISQLRKMGNLVLLSQYVTTSARRHEKIGLLRSVVFMWYLRTLYKFGVPPEQLQRMYIDIR